MKTVKKPAPITLVDGEAMNRAHPETFEIPDNYTRSNLRPGDLVKLGFQQQGSGCGSERMWVVVGFATDNRKYVGLLQNIPSFVSGLKLGDRVDFEAQHVLAHQRREDG